MSAVHLCPTLSALSREERTRLLRRTIPRAVEPGRYLFFKGDPAGELLLLEEGVVKLVTHTEQGDELVMDLMTPGDLLGDAALVDGDTQSYSALAATTLVVRKLDPDLFLQVVGASASAASALAETFALRLRRMTACASEMGFSPAARVAGRLSDLAQVLGRMCGDHIEMELPVKQQELAQLAGTTRETTCRALRQLRRSGIVDYEGTRYRILKPKALEGLRCVRNLPSRSGPQRAAQDLAGR